VIVSERDEASARFWCAIGGQTVWTDVDVPKQSTDNDTSDLEAYLKRTMLFHPDSTFTLQKGHACPPGCELPASTAWLEESDQQDLEEEEEEEKKKGPINVPTRRVVPNQDYCIIPLSYVLIRTVSGVVNREKTGCIRSHFSVHKYTEEDPKTKKEKKEKQKEEKIKRKQKEEKKEEKKDEKKEKKDDEDEQKTPQKHDSSQDTHPPPAPPLPRTWASWTAQANATVFMEGKKPRALVDFVVTFTVQEKDFIQMVIEVKLEVPDGVSIIAITPSTDTPLLDITNGTKFSIGVTPSITASAAPSGGISAPITWERDRTAEAKTTAWLMAPKFRTPQKASVIIQLDPTKFSQFDGHFPAEATISLTRKFSVLLDLADHQESFFQINMKMAVDGITEDVQPMEPATIWSSSITKLYHHVHKHHIRSFLPTALIFRLPGFQHRGDATGVIPGQVNNLQVQQWYHFNPPHHLQ